VPTIILHEVSHGVVANFFGDDTAKCAGRLTLNPFRHIDPIGSVILPIIMILSHGPAFGWAKPVPVAVNRLRHPRNESVIVSLAGPATNVILAFAAGLIDRLWIGHATYFDPDFSPIIPSFIFAFGIVNVVVGAFNLIPIPPLDGSAVLERFIPASMLPGYYRFRQLSLIIVFLLVFSGSGVLSSILYHVETFWERIVFS
jgi:Zn-dependent protease